MRLKLIILTVLIALFTLDGYTQKDTTKVKPPKPTKPPKDTVDIGIITETFSEYGEEEKSPFQYVMPPSPTSAALGMYGEYPVTMATGTPEISIPIYEIKGRKLSLPISLSYHASGIKVDQYASWVGLGWSLNAGGVITRSVHGLPDEGFEGYFDWEDTVENSNRVCFNFQDNNHADYYFLEDVVDKLYDTEPDVFFYNITGDAGKFMISQDTVRPIPYKPVKIIPDLQNSNNKFKIISADGTIYRFGVSLDNEDAFETTRRFTQSLQPRYSVSAWYLTEIISADLSDTIFFKYVSHDISYGSTLHQSCRYYYDFDLWPPVSQGDLSHHDGDKDYEWDEDRNALYIDNSRKLAEIQFSNGKVIFHSSDDRDDLPGTNTKRLTSIEIFSNDNLSVPIKRFDLNYSYFDAEVSGAWEIGLDAYKKKRLKLNSITEVGKPSYEFGYSSIALPPINSFRQDHWGFFNNETLNEGLIHKTTFNGVVLGNANRSPNAYYVTAGILETIQYPTGGRTEFEFEAHDYNFQGNLIAGGVRIKQIRSNDGIATNDIKIKNYDYTFPGVTNSSGKLITHNLNYGYTIYYEEGVELDICLINKYKCFVLNPQTFVELGSSGGSPVHYQYVTVKEGEGGTYIGKSVYKYNADPDIIMYGDDPYQCYSHDQNYLHYVNSNDWKRGKPLEEVHYDNLDNIKKRVVNTYATLDNYITKDIIGLKVSPRTIHINMCVIDYTYYEFGYNYMHTITSNKWIYLTHSSKYEYNQNDDSKYVLVYTDYDYSNDRHAQVTSETMTDSKNNTVEKRYYYPQDYNSNVQNFSTLISKNIISQPIDVRTYNNSILVSGVQTRYNNDGQPTEGYKVEGNGANIAFSASNPYTFTHKATYQYSGNNKAITQVTPVDNFNTAYLWDDSGTYVMAKVENATYNQISTLNGRVCTYSSSSLYSSIKGYAPNAMITTYSYLPLIGLTSQTGPDGRTTYYEYDSFGRLEYIRDHNGNIIKKHEYHYANQ